MKKMINSTDIHEKHGQELSKKLYRSTTEHAKRLDDARSCVRFIGDLFTPSLQIQRRKFCEYCERLIFSDPTLYGRKAEELLWRKGYYDVVSTAKKLKRKDYSQDDVCFLLTHINAGIGFYHHLIAKVQYQFGLNLNNISDFITDAKEITSDECKAECLEWAKSSVHQCLIYLGDLSRYKLEIYPNLEPTSAYRYYLQAISYRPNHGMPHNQMGTLAMHQNRFLDAVHHYMRCLACTVSFEGTNNNLHNLFDKNSKFLEQLPIENDNNVSPPTIDKSNHVKRFIARFLLLIDIWYFNKKVTKVYNLCHQTYKDLEQCLTLSNKTTVENCESPTDVESIETEPKSDNPVVDHLLTNDMIFKIIVICLLCISKLQKINSAQASTAVAFTLAIYSQLIQNVTNHIQDSVLNYPIPDLEIKTEQENGIGKDILIKSKNKRNVSKLRRKKVVEVDSESDEVSEDDEDSDNSSEDSFVSENVLADESSDEEVDTKSIMIDDGNVGGEQHSVNNTNNDKIEVLEKMKKMDVNDMLEIVTEEGSLQAIKIINDWLIQDTEILKSCGTSTRSLLRQITNLLNLINLNVKSPDIIGVKLNINTVIRNVNKIPLSEDVILKETEMLAKAHEHLDWNYFQKRTGINVKEETVIRIIKFMVFGRLLTTLEETGVYFDETNNIFVCRHHENESNKIVSSAVIEDLEQQETENNPVVISDKTDVSQVNGQLMKMKHMGQLWLASEVRALENRVRGKTSLSPYLVLDADALIKYTFMVKHLVNSRKFIVLIPSAVVSALDDLKREQSEARDAIRWLESQFHRGNRFFRAQRPQERAPIPFIKYPKKKDKEMCIYIQIIECCYFLAEQQKGASNLVTLLIGNQNVLSNGENKEFSYVGLAQSAGVSIESIVQFYGKWKKNYKGKR